MYYLSRSRWKVDNRPIYKNGSENTGSCSKIGRFTAFLTHEQHTAYRVQRMLANDVKYHLNCWVKVQRKVASPSVEVQEIEDLSRVLADIEIVNTVDYLVHEVNTIIDMNSLNNTYNNLLRNETEHENYKQ